METANPGVVADRIAASSGGARRSRALEELLLQIRRDLAQGVYHPRERLVEVDLIERYNATRGTVREALLQLASEGLVERRLNRGARVRGMTRKEALEIAEIRLRLEPLCAGRAAERGTPTEGERLLGIAKAMGDSAGPGPAVSEYLRLNVEFHNLIYSMSRHETAEAILLRFQARPIDRFFPVPFSGPAPAASVDLHREIAEAIAAGDASRAESMMRQHLEYLILDLGEVDPE